MNDLGAPDWNNVVQLDRQERRPIERETKSLPKPRGRRRWGGRLFALGGVVALAGGLFAGTSGYQSRQQQVMATAEQERDFVPTVRVATVEPSAAATSVTLPGTTAAFADANIFPARPVISPSAT